MSLRLTGKNRRFGTLEDGSIIWQMMGAEGDGDPADDGVEDEDDADPDLEDDEPSNTGSDAAEIERMKKRMKAADRRAAAAEAKIREHELAGKSELEQAQTRVAQLEAANEELNAKLQELHRERLFLGSNTVTWHDPEIAMAKLDWSSIIDEDGEVDSTALDKAIRDLAKTKPFLVKKEVVESNEDNAPPAGGQPSGTNTGSGKKKSKQEIDREALLKKYPALR